MAEEKNNTAILIQIGNNVTQLRKKHNLTQKQLAYECNMAVRQLRRIEKGEHNIGILHLYTIAEVLETTLSELLEIKELA